MSKRPPLGLKPRWIHDMDRFEEVISAMMRYREAGLAIPRAWQKEHDELRERLKPRLSRFSHNARLK